MTLLRKTLKTLQAISQATSQAALKVVPQAIPQVFPRAASARPKLWLLPVALAAATIPAAAQRLNNSEASLENRTVSMESAIQSATLRPTTQPVGERIPELDRHFEQVAAITARFDQQLIDEDGFLLEEASGEMQLKRPGLFRWDYTEPYYQQIGSDGDTLWIFDQELEQITLRPVAEGLGRTPAVLLSGEGSLYDQFVVSRAGTERDLEWLLLLPREQDTDFKRIRLGFNGDDLMSMELTDSLDQLTRITFSELARNPDISDDNFILRIPDGTEVVGERG